MTTKDMRLFAEGRDYWHEYVRLFGFAMAPSAQRLSKLARLLDLKPSYLRRCIYIFLNH